MSGEYEGDLSPIQKDARVAGNVILHLRNEIIETLGKHELPIGVLLSALEAAKIEYTYRCVENGMQRQGLFVKVEPDAE